MWKNYKAIFFDWDGTAVMSRKAPADDAVQAMRPLLQKGVKLAIISGTTIESLRTFILDWDGELIIMLFVMENLIFSKIWCQKKRSF